MVVLHDVEAERHDRTTLELPGDQDALVRAVAAANPRTIVVLETGSAVLMPWLSSVRAVLETWYPGQESGQSLLDLLSGQVDPSGKLPVTFPASPTLRPDVTEAAYGGLQGRVDYSDDINVGYRWYEANQVEPAFSFGYGLSYTTFGFSDLSAQTTARGGIAVTATVTNTGKVRGADVVQCYVGDPSSTGEPARQLRGFERVDLAPGASQVVHLKLTPGDLAVWDTPSGSWIVTAGTYDLRVGDGSDLANLPLHTTVTLSQARLGPNSGPAPATGALTPSATPIG